MNIIKYLAHPILEQTRRELGIMIRRKHILPPTTHRVFLRTDPMVNAEIRHQTLRNLKIYRGCSKEEITERIRELNLEWDTERVLEANAAMLILLSSILGIKTSRCWFFLTGLVGAFLLQHALQGWCPPVPFLRRWGVRTEDEINAEKIVLKMIRGDFMEENSSIEDILEIAEKQ